MTKPGPQDAPEDDLAEQVAQLRADLARIAETLAKLGAAKTETLRDDGLAAVEDRLAEVTDFARRNPGQALAMAGGFGLILGLIFGRR